MLSDIEFLRAKKQGILLFFPKLTDECIELGLSKAETEFRINRMLEMLTNVNK